VNFLNQRGVLRKQQYWENINLYNEVCDGKLKESFKTLVLFCVYYLFVR